MNQYLIYAFDSTDEGALERRMKVRPLHFEMAGKLKAEGHFILGGSILNEAGTMIGSTMIVQFENEQQLQSWLEVEPYIIHKIWERFEVRPFKVANV
ncbi:hypothetical protein SAMN04515674_11411 [Pseudarcicella hirudinis]|uniref:YCII-related domain-containing protein n=1 Tax=Pseudarcicella hirudinis TaxID=1079859 RepID=A0A1I5X9E3_9BACT|nr:YciI family protein [Pseudarcicella hirudinis]SFQ28599.1 hypothetical protein SAMN04515674_11411 [Pseudarcicella hirudinis]